MRILLSLLSPQVQSRRAGRQDAQQGGPDALRARAPHPLGPQPLSAELNLRAPQPISPELQRVALSPRALSLRVLGGAEALTPRPPRPELRHPPAMQPVKPKLLAPGALSPSGLSPSGLSPSAPEEPAASAWPSTPCGASMLSAISAAARAPAMLRIVLLGAEEPARFLLESLERQELALLPACLRA
eukprot:CAMPEP_0184329958 /NCGR_PEP_ID=MMETSP1049-20130417/144421_1 /TAXON_ID=77928 /ORGANISM="Proteomonas sulcata, Strain CCMP704" /LENGTH=186 /DNA_ID=CAMNT_0026652351 /DNA_START=518 /DNA_END=1081 /DNA_ORIENTATION=+